MCRFFVVANSIASGYLVLCLYCSSTCSRSKALAPHLWHRKNTVYVICNQAYQICIYAIDFENSLKWNYNGNSNTNWLPICQQFDDFCQHVSGAVVASFMAASYCWWEDSVLNCVWKLLFKEVHLDLWVIRLYDFSSRFQISWSLALIGGGKFCIVDSFISLFIKKLLPVHEIANVRIWIAKFDRVIYPITSTL